MARPRVRIVRTDADYETRIVGEPRTPLRDFYHLLMRLSWPTTLAVVAGSYLFANAVFALLYLAIGGVFHARAGSFLDAFFFSVQTMGTIGFGAMYPESVAANLLVVAESTFGLVVTAVATGLIFAKFSRPNARLMFSEHAVIGIHDGAPTLSFRVGNQRRNSIVEAEVRVAVVRTERTAEGRPFYRMVDLELVRPRVLSLSRSWLIMHRIDERSPLYGETAESLAAKEAEIMISISGTDDTWMQTVHGSHRYFAKNVAFGHRHADVLSETADAMILDLTRFHEIEPDTLDQTGTT